MAENTSKLKDITVLYCEDEEYLRDVTKGILESFTKKQYIAEDGAIGLKIFKKHQQEIDLIITDVNMPNMNGLEMAREIKAINPNIPIIVATAFSNSEYLLEAIELGVDKYVLKPINIKKLLDTMKSSLLYHELRDLYRDQLTHLPNRNALLKTINQSNNITVMSLIDIDKFSVLNDLYGEANGDEILRQFSLKVKEYFSSDYEVYRVGSDRFVVLCTFDDKNDGLVAFKQLCHQFSMDININGIILLDTSIDLNITIGIASSNDSHTFEYAQRAILKARQKYLQIIEYDPSQFEQKSDFEENIRWVKKIKTGFDNGSLVPYFQPIVNAQTQEIYKYEALIRYIEDDGTEIAPFVFLPIVKKAKLFPLVIKTMLNGVIEIIKEKNIRVAVNVSFDDITNKNTQRFIFDTLENNQDEAKLLDFEILESEEIEDYELVKEFIINIKAYGCSIGIDDFGAGYSNFNMIDELNVDFVKIDGSLIKEVDKKPKQALIVKTISKFCQKLGVKTVAEFVSSEDIYLASKNLEIDYIQGWYFGKAVSNVNV